MIIYGRRTPECGSIRKVLMIPTPIEVSMPGMLELRVGLSRETEIMSAILRSGVVVLSAMVAFSASASADLFSDIASRDVTLFEDESGGLASGSGAELYSGRIQQNRLRRAIVAFDLSSIPAGSIVTSVTLQMTSTRVVVPGSDVSLHRVTSAWGEGASAAPEGPGGRGAPSQAGDATWIHTFFNQQFWNTPGGDFTSAPSASVFVDGIGLKEWASSGAGNSGLIADVQSWVNNPSMNHGWLVRDALETLGVASARQWASREYAVESWRPTIFVEYTIPSPTGAAVMGLGLIAAARRKR